MQTVIGYGEDALTYWAITQRLPDLLGVLNDQTKPSEAVTLYRPSFGRAASNETSPVGHIGAAFGEFDAIIATSAAIYLIESKWHCSSGISKGMITLNKPQARRHDVFMWYLNSWRNRSCNTWNEFVDGHNNEFSSKFPNMMMPTADSTLGRNLIYTLDLLTILSTDIVNVLLYFTPDNTAKLVKQMHVTADTAHPFRVVNMTYSPIGESCHFVMHELPVNNAVRGHG